MSKNASKNKPIELNSQALDAFEKLKNTLVSNEILLAHPDFSKPFELTTDASNFAIGAVLMQNKRPITFISRTLSKTEKNYAKNEKEFSSILVEDVENEEKQNEIIFTTHK